MNRSQTDRPAERSNTPSRIFRYLATVVALTLLWLVLRFPYLIDVQVWNFLRRNRVDPATLHLYGEFVESNLGSAQEADGSITVRMIAEQYNFVPRCVLVPAGVPVNLRITSADAVHMLAINGTAYGVKVVPGVISKARIQLPQPGEYKLPCHEFCGAGHYAMSSQMVAVPREQFRALGPGERVDCVSH